MDISNMINAGIINLNLEASNKIDAIKEIAKMLDNENRLNDFNKFIEDVLKREAIESTNMDIGVAIPHSNSTYIKQASIGIGRMKDPIDWEDGGELVRTIFLFAVSSEDESITHLDVIAKTAVILIEDDFIEFLQTTTSSKDLLEEIIELIGE